MRVLFVAVTLVASTGVLIAEGASATTSGGITDWSSLGALGVLSGVVFWLLTREMPAARKTFSETLDKINDRHEAQADKHNETLTKVGKQLGELQAHCAQQAGRSE